ncbi:MAG: hypothetical protein IPN65_05770 [Elusimicrobia bacterium]|nr:hypothetical protein [Elusimicrobiota bacterium]
MDKEAAETAEALEAHIFCSVGVRGNGEHPTSGGAFVDLVGAREAVETEEVVEFAVGVEGGVGGDSVSEAEAEGEKLSEEGGRNCRSNWEGVIWEGS